MFQRNRSEDEDYLNEDQCCSVLELGIRAGLCGQRRFGECVNHQHLFLGGLGYTNTMIPERIMPAVSSPPVHSAYPV